MEKPIKDFEDYTIDEFGNVYSYKSGSRKQLATWPCTNGYMEIKFYKNGKYYHRLIHRLVAEAFIPNPHEYEQVNHKDKNIKNNHYTNLEWCSVQYNINYSYVSGMRAVRNHKECILIEQKTQELMGEFESITAACRYASTFLGCSYTGMIRHHVGTGYEGKVYQIKKLDEGVTTNISNGIGEVDTVSLNCIKGRLGFVLRAGGGKTTHCKDNKHIK